MNLPPRTTLLIPHFYRLAGECPPEHAWGVWFSNERGAAVFATREGPAAYIDEDPEQE